MRDGSLSKETLCNERLEIYRILFYQRSFESLVTFVHHFLSWHVDWNVVVASIGGMDGTFGRWRDVLAWKPHEGWGDGNGKLAVTTLPGVVTSVPQGLHHRILTFKLHNKKVLEKNIILLVVKWLPLTFLVRAQYGAKWSIRNICCLQSCHQTFKRGFAFRGDFSMPGKSWNRWNSLWAFLQLVESMCLYSCGCKIIFLFLT